jgi:hypothetical protein
MVGGDMKSALLVIFSILLVCSCEETSTNITMPSDPHIMAKTVDDMDATVPLLSKGKGPFDKVTGDVQYNITSDTKIANWIFNAHNLNTADYHGLGKGKVMGIRSIIATGEVDRTREFNVTYTRIEGELGWFACLCTYDTNENDTGNWYMIYVEDGGEPGGWAGNDGFGWQRISRPPLGLPNTEESAIAAVVSGQVSFLLI